MSGTVSKIEDAQVILLAENHHDQHQNIYERSELINLISEKWGCDKTKCVVLVEGRGFNAKHTIPYDLSPSMMVYGWERPDFEEQFHANEAAWKKSLSAESDRRVYLGKPNIPMQKKRSYQDRFESRYVTSRNDWMKQHIKHFLDQGARVIVVAGSGHFLTPRADFSELNDVPLVLITPPLESQYPTDVHAYDESLVRQFTGVSLARSGKYKAVHDLLKTVDEKELDVANRLIHSFSLIQLNKWDDAEKILLSLRKAHPTNMSVRKEYCSFYFQKLTHKAEHPKTELSELQGYLKKAGIQLKRWKESFALVAQKVGGEGKVDPKFNYAAHQAEYERLSSLLRA